MAIVLCCYDWSAIRCVALLLAFGMSRPNVDQSEGYVARTPDAIDCTISKTLPNSATQVRFLRASVGLGGRLRLYRFTAPVDDLHLHAETEFKAHSDQSDFTATPNHRPHLTCAM